jgi:hypothetical protein
MVATIQVYNLLLTSMRVLFFFFVSLLNLSTPVTVYLQNGSNNSTSLMALLVQTSPRQAECKVNRITVRH